ncbi:MAG: hypothetical protein QM820_59355 [Minicystis sp.]
MGVSIRADPPSVRVEHLTFHEQWVDFYALLALSGGCGITCEALSRVGAWRHKKPGSVGKEVARHLQLLQREGLAQIIESRAKTRQWSLALPRQAVELWPDEGTVAAWLGMRTAALDRGGNWYHELDALLRALILVQRGDACNARTALEAAAPTSSDPGLLALRALVEGRAAYLLDDEDDEVLFQLADEWASRADAAGRAVGARLQSFVAMKHRFSDPAATREALTKLISDLEHRGDIGSLAVLLNVLGLLERRAGEERAAIAHLSRAAPLLAISGDYHLLQAVLYNLSQSRRALLAREGRPADEATLRTLESCLFVCANARVGDDSALAETTAAEWSLERGDLEAARRYLGLAKRLVMSTEASYDLAYFHEVEARVLAHEEGGDPGPSLRIARRIYEEIGDLASAERVGKRIRDLRREGRAKGG